MNTKPTPKRWKPVGPSAMPQGGYAHGLFSKPHAERLAAIVSVFVHLEDQMTLVLAALLGAGSQDRAGYVMRAIKSPTGRIDVMTALLEKAPANRDKSGEFDDVITQFKSCSKRRNLYAHGLWFTGHEGQTVYMSPLDEFGAAFFQAKPVKLSEMDALLADIQRLMSRLMFGEIRQSLLDLTNQAVAPLSPDPKDQSDNPDRNSEPETPQ